MFSFERMEIESDKANHFVYGAVVTMLGLVFGIGVVWSFGVCLAVAVLKEVWDHFYGSKFDIMDIAWTLIGGAVVLAPLM